MATVTISAVLNRKVIEQVVVHVDPEARNDMREFISFGVMNVIDKARKRELDAREYRIEIQFS